MATFTAGTIGVDLNGFKISDLAAGIATVAQAHLYRLARGGDFDDFTGDFSYAAPGLLTDGTIDGWTRTVDGATAFTIAGLNVPVSSLLEFTAANNSQGLLALVFGGNDLLAGSAAGDYLLGFNGDDTMAGLAGNDTLGAGAGEDELDGGIGADRMSGAGGDDIYRVDDPGDLVIEAANQGSDTVVSYIDYTLGANVEKLTLSAAGLTGTGNALANWMIAGAGSATLAGGAGNDSLLGSGSDLIAGDVVAMAGGASDDYYLLRFGNEGSTLTELANQGTDIILTPFSATLGANFENLTLRDVFGIGTDIDGSGNELNNVITGSSGDNLLSGLTGNDTLSGGVGNDTLQGGSGNDVYLISTGTETIIEAAGIDTVVSDLKSTSLADGVEKLTLVSSSNLLEGYGNGLDNLITGNGGATKNLYGDAGNDTIIGSKIVDFSLDGGIGNDSIAGGGGGDGLDGGTGADTMNGGADDDKYAVDDDGDSVIEAANQGNDTVLADITYKLGANLEALTLTKAGLVGTGNSLGNVLRTAGIGTLIGGTGDDRYVLIPGNQGSTLTELANQGTDTVVAAFNVVLGANFENLTLDNSAGDIDGTGNELKNAITGNDDDNLLQGLAGNDTLAGGDGGNDTLQGGIGDDLYIVELGTETISEAAGQGIDTVLSSVEFTLVPTVYVEKLTLAGSDDVNGTGNSLDNAILGNGGDNALAGNEGNDTLTGGDGADDLFGDSGHDSLVGGAGDDALVGGSSSDTMSGGSGGDAYNIDDIGDVVIEGANQGIDLVGSKIDYKLGANVENLALSAAGLTGTGNGLANDISGNFGACTLVGGGGNDTLRAQIGAFVPDTMLGGTGDDHYILDFSGKDSLLSELANQGIDTVETGVTFSLAANFENLILFHFGAETDGTGNELKNVITGSDDDNLLRGLAGNDTLSGGTAGNDTLEGGIGDDAYVIVTGGETIAEIAGEGTDTVLAGFAFGISAFANVENLTLTGSGNIGGNGNTLDNVITGNDGTNVLFGSSGRDTLIGGAGGDSLRGGTGADKMIGGLGNDGYEVDDAGDVVTEAANQGTDSVLSFIGYTLPSNVENLTIAAGAIGTGNTLANLLVSSGGNGTLVGGAGNDTLDGATSDLAASGVDSMTGGTGDDLYILRLGNDGSQLVELANQGIDTVQAAYSFTLGANFENLTLRDVGGNIDGTGNERDNIINGNSGNNLLSGLAGNDTLMAGGAGLDTLQGGLGNDLYLIVIGNETLDEQADQGIDAVQSAASWTLGANLENLTLLDISGSSSGTGNALKNSIVGNASDNVLIGNEDNDTLAGNAGDDILVGGGGGDKMSGGAGDDVYSVDDKGDNVTEAANAGTDIVQSLLDTYSLGANVENLSLFGSAVAGIGNNVANVIIGNAGGNNLSGLSGDDRLTGGGGNDTLLGGAGDDLLAGGLGADLINTTSGHDRVMYAAALDAGDIVQGFSTGGGDQDFIDLDALFDDLGVAAGARAARVSFVDTGADVQLQIDTDGMGGADLVLLTFQAMASPAALTVGSGTNDDVLIGN